MTCTCMSPHDIFDLSHAPLIIIAKSATQSQILIYSIGYYI